MAKILICDDENEQLDICARAFLRLGHSYLGVSTPKQTLREIQKSRYDLVVMDLQNLCEDDRFAYGGYQDWRDKIKRIRPEVRVVAMTNYPLGSVREAFNHFDDVWDKWDFHLLADGKRTKLENLLIKQGI
ncbi:MAG: hypothetical protein Q8P81_03965 [Nanoarchaeota archaeon]|nr:hypothetical protein [Nanoarchaeota archaeon]